MLSSWLTAVSNEFSIQGEVSIDALLDVARVVAHDVERPAVPVTMFLLGQAVAAGEPFDVAVARIDLMARSWDTGVADGSATLSRP